MKYSSMTASSVTASTANVSSPPPHAPEPPHERDVSTDCGPMSRQDMFDAHGHDMHPQKLVRLIGCHADGAAAAPRPARILK